MLKHWIIPFLPILVFPASGCDPSDGEPDSAPPQTLEEAVRAQENELGLDAGRALLNSGVQIGRLDGGPDSIFGMIRDLTIGPRDEVFVLDDRLVQIKGFNAFGELLASTGRGGHGPGEFHIPAAISVASNGSVFVLDRGNLRISVFDLGATGFDLRMEVPTPFPARDLCVLGDDRIFLLGYFEESTIHEVSTQGDLIRSFAPAAPAEEFKDTRWHLRVKQENANGFLTCPLGQGLLVFLSKHFGFVRAFRTDGSLAWEHFLEGFRGLLLRQTERGTLQFAPADGNMSTAQTSGGLLSMPEGILVVQFGVPRIGTDNDFASLETRFLRLSDGEEIGSRSDLPRLGGIQGDLLLGFENSPFPRISLIRDFFVAGLER